MKVQPDQLIIGCVVKEPIYSLTTKPIVPRKTVLNDTHIEFIKVFMINEIEVEEILSNGELFNPQPVVTKVVVDNTEKIKESFVNEYLRTVDKYKILFQGWQNGNKVNINELRNLHYPLLEKAFECPNEVFNLHIYSKKEDFIYHHPIATSLISAILASKLNNNLMESFQISFSALLCDIGLSKIPVQTLTKSGPFSSDDLLIYGTHPGFSYRMLTEAEGATDIIKNTVLQHHERLDGSGYPLKVSGQKIHYYSKIIAVADEFHSLVCDQFQSEKVSPFKAVEILTSEYFGRYDITIARTLSNCICNLEMGDMVMLSDGQIGEVIFIDPNNKTRPIVKIGENNIVGLANNLNIYIKEII